MPDSPSKRPETEALHADDPIAHKSPAVSPDISLTTTFRYPALPEGDVETLDDYWKPDDPQFDIYSRYSRPTTSRVEKVLTSLLNGYAITYPSGISAAFSALIHLAPSTIAITGGYLGCWQSIDIYRRLRPETKLIGLDDEYPQGVLCWLETPVNPTGEARDMRHYAQKTHKAGGQVLVDATFGPPPLQDPLGCGADVVLHSATKYLAGHSDCLMGVLAVKSKDVWLKLWHDRTYTGATPGAMESWLLLRSLRTLHIRVKQQSETATALATWLHQLAQNAPNRGDSYDKAPGGVVSRVWHASLQGAHGVGGDFSPLGALTGSKAHEQSPQMTGGSGTFAILLTNKEYAKWLPSTSKLFTSATSLGGVESLAEHRFVSDPRTDPRLVRLSVGLEHVEDLKEDLRVAFGALLEKKRPSKL